MVTEAATLERLYGTYGIGAKVGGEASASLPRGSKRETQDFCVCTERPRQFLYRFVRLGCERETSVSTLSRLRECDEVVTQGVFALKTRWTRHRQRSTYS